MIRKYINSNIKILKGVSMIEPDGLEVLLSSIYIIQVEPQLDNLIIEYCMQGEQIELIPFTANMSTPKQEPQGDIHKVEEYRGVVINRDPFGKYSDCTLGEVFDNKDIVWINKAIREMRNEWLKDRIVYLKDFYTKGGEQWLKS